MSQPRLCLQTQTPLVRLLRDVPSGTALDDLLEESDYLVSPGGVTRMLRGLVRHSERAGLGEAAWVSLAREPASLKMGSTRLEFVALPEARLEPYARAKTALWNELHGLPDARLPLADVARGLRHLGEAVAARTRELHEEAPFDVSYTHDFQLLETARGLPEDVPRVLRWHVPVRPVSPATRAYVARALDAYDAVIVSTRGYARELRQWGVRTPVHVSYPYLDESRRRVVTPADLDAFDARHGLHADDVAFTLVARMDPMKSHDVAIRALARIRLHAPRARLVLVGGGGFSGGRQGLGISQAGEWRAHLERLAADLGVSDRVTFTGGVSDAELDVAITRSRAVLLPSALEGFGLAAVEGWLYGRPALVSRGAGVAELVREGENGHAFAPGDDAALADAMLRLARDEDLALRMGEEGRRTARACHLARGTRDVWEVLRCAVRAAS